MASVSTYLNFQNNTLEAFTFYKSVFGGEFGSLMRFRDMPPMDGAPNLTEAEKDLIMHIDLTILGCHYLMGTDAPESMGFRIQAGNNMYINLHPDTRVETKRIFDALAVGGTVEMPLQDMFWGDYYGSLTDRFGVKWMVACGEPA